MSRHKTTEKQHDAKRRVEKPWRKWYSTKEWYRLRQAAFKRDSVQLESGAIVPRCRQTGALLFGKHPAPNSPVADHIKRHNGDKNLFFDLRNVQTVSKVWHDTIKQSRERRNARPIGRDGWPIGLK